MPELPSDIAGLLVCERVMVRVSDGYPSAISVTVMLLAEPPLAARGYRTNLLLAPSQEYENEPVDPPYEGVHDVFDDTWTYTASPLPPWYQCQVPL